MNSNGSATASRVRLATVWLDGCSGCHMSFLDMDERLLELSSQFDLVFSPLVDFKTYPEEVDIALVEGAISSAEDEHKVHAIRKRTKFLIAMGDCAVTGNVPAMRNPFGPDQVLDRAYRQNVSAQAQIPCVIVPALLEKVRPIH
jgi:NAD-reducing hydrogenase small subunit